MGLWDFLPRDFVAGNIDRSYGNGPPGIHPTEAARNSNNRITPPKPTPKPVKPTPTVPNASRITGSTLQGQKSVTANNNRITSGNSNEKNRNTLAYYQAEARKMGKTGKAVSNYAYTKLKTRKRGNEGRTVANRDTFQR